MLEQVRDAIHSVPGALVVLAAPPALWMKLTWASPYLKTYRHGTSGALSVLAGVLLSASPHVDLPGLPIVFSAGMICLLAMAATMLWPPKGLDDEQKVR
jgi:hypothetical protein